MSKLQKTQNKSLVQCKTLSQSQNTRFAVLKSSMYFSTSQIVDLNSENAMFRSDIATLNERVQAL